MNDRNITITFKNIVYVLMLVVLCANKSFTASVLSGMEIIAGSRGTILALTADAPFQYSLRQDAQLEVRIFLTGCVYGLKDFSFLKFEKNAPVVSVNAKEKNDGAGIELVVTMKVQPEQPVIVKDKGLQMLFLLSKQPVAEYSWKAIDAIGEKRMTSATQSATTKTDVKQNTDQRIVSSPVQSTPKVENIQAGREYTNVAQLKNVTMLQRGLVSKLVFEFDREVTGGVHRKGDSLEITIAGAKSTLDKKIFEIKPLTLFKRVILSEQGANKDTLRCTIITNLSASGLSYNITQQDDKILSVYFLNQTEQRTAYWTAVTGPQWEHEFTSVPYQEPDLKELGKRAEHDVTAVILAESVFRIKEGEGKKVEAAIAANDNTPVVSPDQKEVSMVDIKENRINESIAQAVPKPTDKNGVMSTPGVELTTEDRMVFTVSNCNIRSLPSTESSVIGRGDAGFEVIRLATSKEWTHISLNGETGWVSSRFLKEIPVVQSTIAQTAVPAYSDNNSKLQAGSLPGTQNDPGTIKKDSVTIQKVSKQVVIDLESEKNEYIKRSIRYRARGRDPFKMFVNESLVVNGKPLVEHCSLVGLLVDEKEKTALFEDKLRQRRPFILKENDLVENGKVLKIYRDRVVFLLTEFGISRSYTVKLIDAELEQEVRVR